MTREEAIRRVKAWNLDSDDREVLEVIIPELRESDDEKTRKALIEVLHRLPASAFDYGAEGGYIGATKEQMLAYLEKQKEQKPECSEEDKNMIERIVETIQDYALETGQIDAETGGTKEPLISYINFLWSLCPQQKQAWNEEDEKILEGTIMWLNDLEKQGEYVEKERDWLKSLRPQSHWKPSEEQMEALKNSAYGAYQNGDGPALRELYEQLEKL